MFRLMKLAVYGLIGYCLYEFVRGLTEGNMGQTARQETGGSRELNRALDRGPGRATSNQPSREDVTADATGHSVRHRVGQGVISR